MEYDRLDRAEDRMWWFAAVHANLLTAYRRLRRPGDPRPVLDAGCGTGGFLARLAAREPSVSTVGLDAAPAACRRAAVKSGRPVCAGSVNDLPFAAAAFGAIFSVDVLCHRDVDEPRALAQFYRALGTDGLLIVSLPAYRWMMSRHDAAVYNARRYTRRSALALLSGAGFRPIYATYWNTVLFPLMAVTRKLLPGGGSDVDIPSRPVELIGRAATAFERAWLRTGLTLPFGGSVLAVAAKLESPHG